MRFKTTVICQTCAKVKNVCQTCLLDLEYGLPTQVRDTALAIQTEAPTSDINREYYAQNMEAKVHLNFLPCALGPLIIFQLQGNKSGLDSGRAQSAGKEMLKELARTDPYYKRNRPKICSFFAKGECSRGNECPYRHEKPVDDDLAHQNLQDRYYGRNDPVARKIMASHTETQGLKPPDDLAVVRFLYWGHFTAANGGIAQTSIFLSSLSPESTELSIRTRVLQSLPKIQPTDLKSVIHVAKTRSVSVLFSPVVL